MAADSQLVSAVKTQILAESQGVGDLTVVNSLSGVNSLPALKGTVVVEVPIELLAQGANEAAERADAAAQQAVEIANNAAIESKEIIDKAIANANDTAEHPTKIGEDNYVYVWNKETKAYDKTSIYVRGEGFKISKVYPSVDSMMSDVSHGLKEGDFVLVNTGDVEDPENAQIYVVNSISGFSFLVDMSGAIGFTGKTPQLEIGNVSAGTNKSDASASLSANGTDDDGNPRYLLSVKLPLLSFDDLSEENIAELQAPANDMIAQLTETDNAVKEAEALRVSAETSRESAESERKTAESLRKSAETDRKTAEQVRISEETKRATAENARISAETARVNAEATRRSNETRRQEAETERKDAETEREDAETLREKSEKTRENNENLRKIAETTRESNEGVRKSSEELRVSNETQRNSNETTREKNESTRMTNEEGRVEAENERSDDYAALREDILEATANANNAATESRNTPIIQDGTWWIWNVSQDAYMDTGTPATSKSPKIVNGTWWTWDDDNAQYEDTGQAVSSDYRLTKEKIEGVFKGDIQSHYHSQYAEKTELPTKVSELENDKEYITADELESKDYVDNNTLNESLGGKQDVIADLSDIRDGAQKGATALQEIPEDYVTEEELESKGYATNKQLTDGLAAKQDTIGDIAEIRSGAALGSTALQSVPEDYVTLEELDGKQYVTSSFLEWKGYATTSELEEGLGVKQDKNLYFNGLSASAWVADDEYKDFGYRCDITLEGVTADMVAEVIFGLEDASSGNYAPICETGEGFVRIWSSSDRPMVIPTIIINK